MKTSCTTVALAAFLAAAGSSPFVDAFTPVTTPFLVRSTSSNINSRSAAVVVINGRSTGINASSFQLSMVDSGFLGQGNAKDDSDSEDEDEEEDEDEDDDDGLELASASSRYGSSATGAKSPFSGLSMDPWDPNPRIKPRPSRVFKDDDLSGDITVPDDQLVQTMSSEERKENLSVMRQIRKSDLPDLRMRKDHAGWVEANNDMKRRYKRDPWFGVNERLRDAILLGDEQEKIDSLKALATKLGGPPPGITLTESRGYAVHTEIYGIGLSPNRAQAMLEREVRADRSARGRAMMAERRKNMEKQQQQYEEDMRNPGVREDREAKERRERVMRRLMAEIEEDNKKKRERAKELLGKLPDTPESRTASMDKALKEARDEVIEIRRKQLGKAGSGAGIKISAASTEDVAGEKSGADKAREAAAVEASGGRPRLPGDADVTRGELSIAVQSSSLTTTGPLQVQVSSVYNKEQSDPPMRKHVFQYTIRITNNSPTDTIQLLGRRFEIQTVGSSMKDVVQGEGVTGRTPVLKPGEVFEYTSTAPLSVRPIGTTEIAARMRGEYRYIVLSPGQETASEAQLQAGGDATAELGTFHFVFPDDQRVQPFRGESSSVAEDDDEDEDDDDDVVATAKPMATPKTTAPAKSASSASSTSTAVPPSTIPGDQDMRSGDIAIPLNDKSDAVTENVKVSVTSSYRPERSDASLDKHCFAYNIRITNQSTSNQSIQLVSRRFEIQTIGSSTKDVVQGPGVTGRQPILKPGESFEYTSTAPLSVKPMLNKTPAVARMEGEYNFVVLSDDGTTPLSSEPLRAKLGLFHFVLPSMESA